MTLLPADHFFGVKGVDDIVIFRVGGDEPFLRRAGRRLLFGGRGGWAEGACLALVLLLLFACVTALIAETNNPFIYFRF